MKILFLDIETSPNVAHVWGIWQQNVSLNQLLESSYTLCWAAKWHGDSEVMFDSVYQSPPKKMVRGVHKLIEQADMVVHYHGTSFDIPTLNKEYLLHNLPPPSPVKEMDLLKVVRSKFRFPSNKLDYVAQRLGLGKKYDHEGHTLWVKCMNNDPEAWREMEKYNRHDVVLLEKLYRALLPWMKTHLNHSLLQGKPVCPTCGHPAAHKRGLAYTQAGVYQRYQCLGCHGWYRGVTKQPSGKERRVAL
jgi:DNA polymerase elongation subunit (family B)